MQFPHHPLFIRRRQQDAAEVGELLVVLVADWFDRHAKSIARGRSGIVHIYTRATLEPESLCRDDLHL